MPWGASHYPISQLIHKVVRDSGSKRSQFITSLGYRNITGGLRSFDHWLETGTDDPLLILDSSLFGSDKARARLRYYRTRGTVNPQGGRSLFSTVTF